MGNTVHIEQKKHANSDYLKIQVSDEYAESPWFELARLENESVEELIYRCSVEDDQAGDIIQAAIHNNTSIETPLGDLRGSTFASYLAGRIAREDAEFDANALDDDTTQVQSRKNNPRL